MFEIVTKLILHKQLKMEKGEIELFNQRVVMLSMLSLIEIHKELERSGNDLLLYKATKEFGINWAKDLGSKYKFKKSDVFKWGLASITLAGWGDAEVISEDKDNKVLKFTLKNSAVSQFYGSSNKAVDHIFRGMAAGSLSIVYGEDMGCIETSCASMGAPYCEFTVKPTNKFDLSNDLVKKQLGVG